MVQMQRIGMHLPIWQNNIKLPWVLSPDLAEMADLTEKIKAKGVEDLVLDPGGRDLGAGLALGTTSAAWQSKRTSVPWVFR